MGRKKIPLIIGHSFVERSWHGFCYWQYPLLTGFTVKRIRNVKNCQDSKSLVWLNFRLFLVNCQHSTNVMPSPLSDLFLQYEKMFPPWYSKELRWTWPLGRRLARHFWMTRRFRVVLRPPGTPRCTDRVLMLHYSTHGIDFIDAK